MEDKYVVPSELADEGEAMLQLLQEAAKAQGKEADLYLLSAKSSVGFEPVTICGRLCRAESIGPAGSFSTGWEASCLARFRPRLRRNESRQDLPRNRIP